MIHAGDDGHPQWQPRRAIAKDELSRRTQLYGRGTGGEDRHTTNDEAVRANRVLAH